MLINFFREAWEKKKKKKTDFDTGPFLQETGRRPHGFLAGMAGKDFFFFFF